MQKIYLIIVLSIYFTSVIAEEKEIISTQASAKEEFRVKRDDVFEFVQKPQVTNEGNNFTISFESKGFCDVTIAIENAQGKIIRHLACGVLGPKAPAPFQKNSKAQKIIWDGKDDQDSYIGVAEQNGCIIRVSLGLKPQFEKTLFWSPKKRLGVSSPAMRATPEGVYIAESGGIDQVRLFDHQGNYVKTIYPFPSEKLEKVDSLKMHSFLQDGKSKPLKRGYLQSTLLTVSSDEYNAIGLYGIAAVKNQIAVVGLHLNRLSNDGSSGGLPIYGPKISLPIMDAKMDKMLVPRSMVFSPDGKWLYFAGYHHFHNSVEWLNAVTRMPYDGSQPPSLWAGDLTQGKSSNEEGKFRMPTSIASDANGRIYISDYCNDRIQVFNQDGKHLKSISIAKPAYVSVHQKTGDIYVFSFLLFESDYGFKQKEQPDIDATMSHLGSFDNPILKSKCPLPLTAYQKSFSWNYERGFQFIIELDSWAEKPTVWIINSKNGINRGGTGETMFELQRNAKVVGAQIFEEIDGKLVAKHSFTDDITKSVVRTKPPVLWRQRLTVNPATGELYVLEGDSGVMKACNQVIVISPDTGAIKLVDLPLGSEDLCFDVNGLAYLRTDNIVARYDPKTWLEIPFDYGIEVKAGYNYDTKGANLVSGLSTPGHRSFNFWQLGGIDVSLKGHIAVTTCNGFEMENIPALVPGYAPVKLSGKPYKPEIYPGRMRWGEIHIWDKHGKVVKEDAVPGMGHLNGIGIDQEDNIYLLAVSRRVIDSKPIDPAMGYDASGTVIKVLANKNKTYSPDGGIPVPLPKAQSPKRSVDITTGWVEGAEWFYGGVGYCTPRECICWNSRFTKDYFNRSFAPEPQNYSVAVIDTGGNLILRVGKYGNIDDGKPLIPEGGPKETRSIGGDEVGLFYACYVASHTDKRLFIADAGNTRILSVKLGYNTEEKIFLKNVIDKK